MTRSTLQGMSCSIDDFKLLMVATRAVIPLLIVFKQASGGRGSDQASGAEL
jgi:hypothetical protein